MNSAITAQVDYIKDLYRLQTIKYGVKDRLTGINQAYYTKRICFSIMKYRFEVYKRNKRIDR